MKFIVLTDARGAQKSHPHTYDHRKPFLQWQVGNTIRRKNNPLDMAQIMEIGSDGRMRYGIDVRVAKVDGRQINYNSSTLQTGWEHVPEEVAHATLPKPSPLALSVSCIRNFYPRRNGRDGTRVMMIDGTAYAVTESFDDVLRLVSPEIEAGEED